MLWGCRGGLRWPRPSGLPVARASLRLVPLLRPGTLPDGGPDGRADVGADHQHPGAAGGCRRAEAGALAARCGADLRWPSVSGCTPRTPVRPSRPRVRLPDEQGGAAARPYLRPPPFSLPLEPPMRRGVQAVSWEFRKLGPGENVAVEAQKDPFACGPLPALPIPDPSDMTTALIAATDRFATDAFRQF